MVLIASLLCACAPTGDFGRPKPSIVHDKIVPRIGASHAINRGEAVTFLPLTDNEKRLRASAYTIVVAQDILGWRQSVKPYWRYHNIVRPWPHTTPVNAYHGRLLSQNFVSADTRFSRVLSDMRKDRAAIGPFERRAAAVLADDTIRRKVIETEPDLAARSLAGANARMTDNERIIGLVSATMAHRLKVYAYALRHFAVETPTRRLAQLEDAYRRLEADVDRMSSRFDGQTDVARRNRNGDPIVLLDGGQRQHGAYGAGPQAYSLARPR